MRTKIERARGNIELLKRHIQKFPNNEYAKRRLEIAKATLSALESRETVRINIDYSDGRFYFTAFDMGNVEISKAFFDELTAHEEKDKRLQHILNELDNLEDACTR
jgi:hypothetical protein